jgi:hypothetical protein
MHASRLENGVIVTHVAFVVHLDEDVAVTALMNPVGREVGGANNRGLVAQALVLAEVEVTQDHDHPEFVRAIQDAFEARHIIRAQGTIFLEG